MIPIHNGHGALLWTHMNSHAPPKPTVIDPTLVADSQSTVETLLNGSGRKGRHVPIRNSFVQGGRAPNVEPGPLAHLVKHRDLRALQLYLLIMARASESPWDVKRPAAVWARALNLDPTTASGRAAVSKALRRLEGLRLIRRERENRRAKIFILREDGSGKEYTHPGDPTDREGYFQLSFDFWTERWHERLDLPAIAMLLILLRLPKNSRLPLDQVKPWYGISRATAQRGFGQLRAENALHSYWVQRPDPLSPEGYRFDLHHRLREPFTPPPRRVDADSKGKAKAKPTAAQRRRERRRKVSARANQEGGTRKATITSE